MHTKPPYPPAAISIEARAWLDDPANADTKDLSTMPIAETRARMLADFAPLGQAVLAETGGATVTRDIAGVRCLIVTPQKPVAGRKLVYAFGGGWTLGSPEEDLTISARLAAATGAEVISPAYRLAPEHPFPAGLDDVTKVLRAVLSAGGRVAVAGESAGGNLLLGALHRLRRTNETMPLAAALMSPATDKSHYGDSALAARDPSLSPVRIAQIQDLYAPGVDLTDPELSPIYGPFDAAYPPVLLTSGTRDMLLSQSVRLARVMREAGAEVDLRVWEGMWHVFEWYPHLPEARASLVEIGAFLNRLYD